MRTITWEQLHKKTKGVMFTCAPQELLTLQKILKPKYELRENHKKVYMLPSNVAWIPDCGGLSGIPRTSVYKIEAHFEQNLQYYKMVKTAATKTALFMSEELKRVREQAL